MTGLYRTHRQGVMSAQAANTLRSQPAIVTETGLDALLSILATEGYKVIGPRLEAGAITLGPIERSGDLPIGVRDEQTPGHYRTVAMSGSEMLAHAAPAMPWKWFLYPPDERLFHARRSGSDFSIDAGEPSADEPPLALFAIRPCDLAAIAVLDAVLGDDTRTADDRYRARRERTFIVAADCSYATDTCFCASMGTGPRATAGFDLVLSKIPAPAGGSPARMLVAA
jgi:sulfhydrogenase subunit beta (sulfur reductase)